MTDDAPAHLRHLLARLHAVRKDGTGWSAKCPAHEDDHASLHVALGDDGARIVLHCHAGCAVEDVVKAAGVTMAALFPGRPGADQDDPHAGRHDSSSRSPRARPFGEPTATYDYIDETGALLFQVQRDANKSFRQRRPDPSADPGEPTWINDVRDVRKVPYRLPEVRSAAALGVPIWIVEGEKDADALASLGLVATTNAGGAGKWTDEHAEALTGARDVIIAPDNDEPGMKHARLVRKSLHGKVARTRIIRLPDLPPKGDVSDWIAAGGTKEALAEILTRPHVPDGWISAGDLMRLNIPDVDEIVPNLLVADTNAVISGDSGVWKSWFAWDWAIALANGMTFVDRFQCRKSRVMIVSADEPIAETRRKILYLAAYSCPNGSSSTLDTDLLVHGNEMTLTDPEELAKLTDAVADFMPDIIFIDSMDATIEGEENRKEFVANARKAARAIRDAHRPCAIVFIHHWNKPSKDRPNTPASRLRGFSGLRGFVSQHIAIERSSIVDGVATVTVDKYRSGEELPPFSLIPRIIKSEGIAHFEYAGDAKDRTGQSGATKAVLEVLTANGGHMRQPDIYKALAGKYARVTLLEAISTLAAARPGYPPKVRKEPHGNSAKIYLVDAHGAPVARLDEAVKGDE